MYRFFSSYPMLRVLLPMVAGVLLCDHALLGPRFAFPCLITCCLMQIPGFIWLSSAWYFRLRFIMGVSLQLAVLSMAILLYSTHIPEYNKQHLGITNTSEPIDNEIIIKKYLGVAGSFDRYEAMLLGEKTAMIYLYLKPDKLGIRPVPGTVLSVNSEVSPIPEPEKEDDFNFRRYAYHQGITHQSFCYRQDWKVLRRDKPGWKVYPMMLQAFLAKNIRRFVAEERSAAILTALVCGDKRLIDKDLRDQFSKTGSMHVLAVSGLHVGILFLILSRVWKLFFGASHRNIYRFVFLMVGIWTYAAVTGFSSSVSRASLMFSFILLSQVLNRPAQINNSILAAAVILICINPHNLFQLGFQLSFSAVWGIVNLQPLLLRTLTFDHPLLHQIWELTTVSLAAQLATMPLSISTFGNLPCVFLLANYIVIPLAGILLFGGLILSLISWIPFLADGLGTLLSSLVALECNLIDRLSSLPFSNLEPDWPGLTGIFAFYALLWTWSKLEDLGINRVKVISLRFALLWQISFLLKQLNLPI